MTKKDMVKQIVVTAATEKVNWIDGMWLVDIIALNNYEWAIKDWFDRYLNTDISAKQILAQMVRMTCLNTMGTRGRTATSSRVREIFNMFE